MDGTHLVILQDLKGKWMNKCNTKENLIGIISSFIVGIVFGFNSSFHPWRDGNLGIDSSVFSTIAFMMDKGYVPYKDSFDHKGPIIYILNWCGNRIDRFGGLWTIEVLVLFITFFLIYKIACMQCNEFSSIVVVLISASLLFEYYQGGNFTEEYAMPCIAAAIYIFLDYINNARISKKRLIISGMCLGIVLMLRPNMISIWLVYSIYIGFILINEKEFSKILYFAKWFILGITIIIIPLLIWMALHSDINYFIHDYIIFNIRYSSSQGGRADFTSRIKSFYYFFNNPIVLVTFICTFYYCKSYKTHIYFIYLVLTLILMVMSGDSFAHYGMVLVPAVAYPVCLMFKNIENVEILQVGKLIKFIVVTYLLTTIVFPKWMPLLEESIDIYNNRDNSEESEIVRIVDELTLDDEAISVYGIWNEVYLKSNRPHATRYSYQFPIGEVMPQIMDEYMIQLQKEQPRVIVVEGGKYDERIQSFLEKNGYILYYSEDEDIRYCGSVFLKIDENQ